MVNELVGRLCRDLAAVVRSAGLDAQALAVETALAAATPPARPSVADTSAGASAAGVSSARAPLTRAPSADPVAVAAERVAAAYLPGALDSARSGAAQRLGEVFGELSAELRWTQTAAYVAAPPHEEFLGRYAHAPLLGPATAAPPLVDPTGTAVVGVLLLGPGNRYPHHHHPADEVYVPLTDALWSSGLHEPHRPLAPGRPLHHRPGREHAIRTGEGSLLALYLWTGDTTTAAQLC